MSGAPAPNPPNVSPEDAAAKPGTLGVWTCTALVVGNTIGVGVFVLPAALAPYGFNAMIGWAVTAAGCLVLARVFAMLASRDPSAGGPYGYIRATQGGATAFLTLWCYWASICVTNATIAVGVVAYVQPLAPALAGLVPQPVQALAAIWLLVGVNLLGLRSGGRVQVATTVLKLAPMAAIIALGLWLALSRPEVFVRHPPTTPIGLGGIMAASTLALFAMLGLESAAVPAGRVRDPARTIPLATQVGTLITAAIYIAVSFVPMLTIPQAELGRSSAPFADLLGRFLGPTTGQVLALFVVVSGLGALNGWTLLAGELTRSMAAQRLLPNRLARLNRHGAPALALIATATLASAMVAMNYSKSMVEGFTVLSVMVTAANLPLYIAAALALVVLSRRGGGSLEAPVLGAAAAAYCLFALIGVGRDPFAWLIVLLLAGGPIYLLARRRRAFETSAPRHA